MTYLCGGAIRFSALTLLACSCSWGQQAFRLICRGDASLHVLISPADSRNSHQKLGLFFRKSTVASGPKGDRLQPGTCAWVDRPINGREPDILAQDIGAGARYTVQYDPQHKYLVGFQPSQGPFGWVNDLHDPNKRWTFYAYNTNQGELKATRSLAGVGVLIDDSQ